MISIHTRYLFDLLFCFFLLKKEICQGLENKVVEIWMIDKAASAFVFLRDPLFLLLLRKKMSVCRKTVVDFYPTVPLVIVSDTGEEYSSHMSDKRSNRRRKNFHTSWLGCTYIYIFFLWPLLPTTTPLELEDRCRWSSSLLDIFGCSVYGLAESEEIISTCPIFWVLDIFLDTVDRGSPIQSYPSKK